MWSFGRRAGTMSLCRATHRPGEAAGRLSARQPSSHRVVVVVGSEPEGDTGPETWKVEAMSIHGSSWQPCALQGLAFQAIRAISYIVTHTL